MGKSGRRFQKPPRIKHYPGVGSRNLPQHSAFVPLSVCFLIPQITTLAVEKTMARWIALLFILISSCAAGQTASDETTIRQLLDKQVAAWNRHDLEGFMAGYWDSPQLTFFSGGTVTTGSQPTLERYRKRYQGEGREMGTLHFADLRVESLGPDAAFVRGAYELTMSSGKKPHGLFTLVLRKLPEGWRIVHDHTSSAE